MWNKSFRAFALFAVVFSLSTGGCAGGCSSITPAAAPMPTDQTIEGGVQVRVTQSGFQTLTSILPAALNATLASGFCVGEIGPVGLGIADVSACGNPDCAGGATGCHVTLTLDTLNMSVPDPQTFRIDTTFDMDLPVPVTADWIIGGSSSCTLDVTLTQAHVVADIAFSIDPATGELRINLTGIPTLDLTSLSVSGCGVLGSILDGVLSLVTGVIDSAFGGFIIDALMPVIDGFVQGLIPHPLGIEGQIDLGKMLSGITPGLDAKLETKAVAGGYVSLPAQGLSVGMITGFNSDRDPSTRDPSNESESSLCVPARDNPDYNGILPAVPGRNTFALLPADEFMGTPDPAADIAIGVSKTVLNLAGFHIINSGAMCLGVGSSTVAQLNLGTIGILVPSLAELGNGTGKEPMLLVLRPQNPLTFLIGQGTMTDPRLTIGIKDMDVDFYAFIDERYIRAFTITLNLNAGLNLDFTLDAMGKPALQPMLIGIDSSSIQVKVSNAEFLREQPAMLEAVFPTLFDLVLPLLSGTLKPFPLPSISGFSLSNLQTDKITTSQDDFFAIYANLAPTGPKAQEIAEGSKFLPDGAILAQPEQPFTPVDTAAKVVRVSTPAPARIRDALQKIPGGAMPEIELDLGGTSATGGALEWSWNLDGGMWRVWSSDPHPILRDPAFAVQGRHTINVMARAKGDYRTFDPTPIALDVVIDSAAPRILTDRTTVEGGDAVFVASDLVTEDENLEWQFADATGVATAWEKSGGHLPLDQLAGLVDANNLLTVAVRDEKGNEARASVDVSTVLDFHGRVPASSGGCGCAVGGQQQHGGGSAAGAIFGLLALGSVFGARKKGWVRRLVPFVLIVVAAGFAPACDCSKKPNAAACMVDSDCTAQCAPQIGICQDGMCFCADDIEIGAIGKYQDLATTSGGPSWVSAYNTTHGDLMVAQVNQPGRIPDETYEFVDGVPDGPVVLPQSHIRGGIRDDGEDVGLYTSIAADSLGQPEVSYFDSTNASLKYAAKFNGTWVKMTVDKGAPIVDMEIGGSEVGRYSTISVSQQDGRPAIAYMAVVYDGGVGHTELRFAQAMVPQPSAQADWNLWIVDQAPLPAYDPMTNPMPADLPDGVGLFVASARMPDGAPVLAYYDRVNGQLKLAYFDLAQNTFKPPVVLDGSLADGHDVGWYPSVTVTDDSVVHVSYISAEHDDLMYIDTNGNTPEIVDDGYRIDGTTADGIPRPVYHLVGDDSGLVDSAGTIAVAYQDATSHELLLSVKNNMDGTWTQSTIAGDPMNFMGGYGFYAAAKMSGTNLVMSTYVIDQPTSDQWVEVFSQPLVIQ